MNNTPRRPDSFICLLSLRGGEGAIGEFEAYRIFSFSNFPQARNSGRPHHGGNWALAVTTAGTARQPVRPTRLGRSRRDGNSLLTLYFTPFELLGNRSGRHGDRSGFPRRRASVRREGPLGYGKGPSSSPAWTALRTKASMPFIRPRNAAATTAARTAGRTTARSYYAAFVDLTASDRGLLRQRPLIV